MDASKLTSPSAIGSVTIDGDSFTLEDVTADILFVLMATGSDETLTCTTDVVGFDETTKVVNADSAITFNFGDLDSYVVPTPVRLYCEAPLEEPWSRSSLSPRRSRRTTAASTTRVTSLREEATPGWTTFTISDKTGATTYGDASAESVAATNLTCDENPSVLQVYGETEDTEPTTPGSASSSAPATMPPTPASTSRWRRRAEPGHLPDRRLLRGSAGSR